MIQYIDIENDISIFSIYRIITNWCSCVALREHFYHLSLPDGWTNQSTCSHSCWHWNRHRGRHDVFSGYMAVVFTNLWKL